MFISLSKPMYTTVTPVPLVDPLPEIRKLADAAGLSAMRVSLQYCARRYGNVIHHEKAQYRNGGQLSTDHKIGVATA